MKAAVSIARFWVAWTALAGFAGASSVAAAAEEMFFAYGCGVVLCSASLDKIPESGLTRSRFVLSDRYASTVSITLKAAQGKTLVVMDWVKIPFGGAAYERHHAFEISEVGSPSTVWLNTDTDGEYDFLVVKGRQALADVPYPRGPVEHIGSPIIISSH